MQTILRDLIPHCWCYASTRLVMDDFLTIRVPDSHLRRP